MLSAGLPPLLASCASVCTCQGPTVTRCYVCIFNVSPTAHFCPVPTKTTGWPWRMHNERQHSTASKAPTCHVNHGQGRTNLGNKEDMPGIPSNHMPDMPLWQHGSSCQDVMPCHRPCRTSLTTSRQFREGSCQMVMSSQQIWKPTRHSMCPRNEWCDDAATKQIIVFVLRSSNTIRWEAGNT